MIIWVKFVTCFFYSWGGSYNKYFNQLINISVNYDKTTEVLFVAVKEKKFLKKNIFINEVGQLVMLWINLEERLKSRIGELYNY